MEIKPIKILLVEDIPGDVLMLRLMLSDVKGTKFDIAEVNSPQKGLAQLEKNEFDAVLLNLLLKNNTGFESLLRIQEKAPQTPVIILTSQEDQAMAFEAVRKGAQDYLVKGKLDGNLLYRVIHYAIERHRVMEELKEKNEELERLNSLKSEFVSTVSHELRTPLTVVLSASNNLLDGAFGNLNPDQNKWVDKINHHALKLHQMISDILDLSKLQSGKAEMRRDLVEPGKLIEVTVANLQILAKEKKISLSQQLPEKLPSIWGDTGRLEQVLTNLITNAIKFTPAGGSVEISAEERDKHLFVAVSDTGPGIAPEHREIIFDRFRQIRSAGDQTSTKGIGLGLAICKEILDQHQGSIWVESEAGKGSRFQFKIPIESAVDRRPVLKILVVDDDPEICSLLESLLKGNGHLITTAKNGKQAIQYWHEKNSEYDVVFLDLMLPGASGVEVIKEIRQIKSRTEVVIITAYPDSKLLFEGMAYGPLTIIAKPFDPKNILEVTQKFLSQKASRGNKEAA